jgi:hypothetical protein
MIYDSLSTKPLMGTEGVNVLLPAEALLATIEVKTTLSAADISSSLSGIKSQYALSPWGDPWGITRHKGEPADKIPRLFTTIFAYETDLGKSDWAEKEMSRIREQAQLNDVSVEYLNRVVVLDRGLLIPSVGDVAQTANAKGILSHWFFTLIYFLAREVERRKPFPWADYEIREQLEFENVAPALHDAPAPTPRTSAKRSRMRKKGLQKHFDQN